MKRILSVVLMICVLASFSAAYAGKSEASQTANAAGTAVSAGASEDSGNTNGVSTGAEDGSASPENAAEQDAEPSSESGTAEQNAENDPAAENDSAETKESAQMQEVDASTASDATENETADEEVSSEPEDFTGILDSDETAIDFLEGYWTNGRSDYIYAGRGDNELINWQMNLPYPACNQYIFTDGVLTGMLLNTKGEKETYDIFEMEIVDRNTVKVKSFYTGEETEFIRDALTVDPTNLSDEYVFWTMDRAAVYLEGEWMSPDFEEMIFSNENGFQMNTTIPCPVGSGMDFCDLELCTYTMDQQTGKKTFEKAYRFNILGKDTMSVHCYENDTDYMLSRISADIDEDNLDPAYVFYCNSRAYNFLLGKWMEEDSDNYFELFEQGSNVGWKTSLPLEEHYTYKFGNGGLVGVDVDDDQNMSFTDLYEFDIISPDEIVVHVLSDDSTHTLLRSE